MSRKDPPPIVLEADGSTVELRKHPVRRYDWGFAEDKEGNRIGHPMERQLYAVHVDGAHVGWLTQPHGWGAKPWTATMLLDTGYSQRFGEGILYRGNWHRDFGGVTNSEGMLRKVAAMFPAWRREGKALTVEEIAAAEARWKTDQARQKAQEERQMAVWRAEAAARKARDEQLRAWRSDRFREYVEALEAIAAGHNDARTCAEDVLKKYREEPEDLSQLAKAG